MNETSALPWASAPAEASAKALYARHTPDRKSHV